MEYGFQDLLGVAPLLLGVVAGLTVITLDIFLVRGDDQEIMPAVTSGALVGMLGLLGCLWGLNTTVFGGHMVIDGFGVVTAMVCTFVALVSVLMAPRYLERKGMEYGEFYGLILFSLCGMILMCMAQTLVLAFLALETMSLAIYALVGMSKRDPRAAEAATKYFVLGAFGSGFFVFGIGLIFLASGTTDISAMAAPIEIFANQGAGYLLLPGMAMLIIGFLFKIGGVPFHTWVPDVYEGSPQPVMAFMGAGVKVAAAVVLGRVLFQGLTEHQLVIVWKPILAAIAGCSLVIGATTALIQRNIQRMLGYSAVAHTGFLLLAFLGAEGSPDGFPRLVIFLVAYGVSAIGMLAVLSQLARGDDDVTDLEHIRGLGHRRPGLATAAALFMLSLAGIPGTVGFVGKLSVI